MCNCKAPYSKMYSAYQKAAAENCQHFPAGTGTGTVTPGQASCIATALGYLKVRIYCNFASVK